jgi:hypothetical protein
MKTQLLSLFLALSFYGFSQDKSSLLYTSSSIPDSLKKDASAVFRLDEAELEVQSPSRYRMNVHQVITVLNKEGEHHFRHRFGIDKFYTVPNVQIALYNDQGVLVKTYNKKDFQVESAYDNVSLITDDKLMHFTTPNAGFPCTMDVKYTLEANSYVDLPDWIVNTNEGSTEQFRYVVKVPADLDIRHRTQNFNITPRVTTENKTKVYTWEAKNIKVNKIEAGGYELSRYLPQVDITPNRFEYDGFGGSFASWKEFGNWNYPFYQDKNGFTPQRIEEIRSMVTANSDTRSKVNTLYQYLQNNMRYVSIQLGIGGFRPFPVRFVDEKKYGDCKALTNYMRNLLSVVGIKSYPALINAGDNRVPVDADFPSDPFNHVILCVPAAKDTIWLECTSNYNEPGFLSSFTENRNALLLTEEGGKLVRTPHSNYTQNSLVESTTVTVDENGGAKVSGKIYSTGSYRGLFSEITRLGESDQKEAFVHYLQYKAPDKFGLVKNSESRQTDSIHLDFEYDKYYDFKAGTKLFISKHLNKLSDLELKTTADRKIDYLLDFPFSKTFSTKIILPENIQVETLPASKEIVNQFGSYKTSAKTEGRQVELTSVLIISKYLIRPNEYNEAAKFFSAITENEGEKLILKKLD